MANKPERIEPHPTCDEYLPGVPSGVPYTDSKGRTWRCLGDGNRACLGCSRMGRGMDDGTAGASDYPAHKDRKRRAAKRKGEQ
jgi:hypothetical protein